MTKLGVLIQVVPRSNQSRIFHFVANYVIINLGIFFFLHFRSTETVSGFFFQPRSRIVKLKYWKRVISSDIYILSLIMIFFYCSWANVGILVSLFVSFDSSNTLYLRIAHWMVPRGQRRLKFTNLYWNCGTRFGSADPEIFRFSVFKVITDFTVCWECFNR